MKRRFVYARTLDDLREKEKRIQKDKCDGIKTEARYTTIDELFDLWANMKRGLKITFLPFVFLAVRVESRFSRNVVLVESSADIVLVFGGKVRFFPVEAVVFSAAEMGYQLAFQRLEILVGNFIEQVADSPRDMYLLCRLKIGALAAILWNTQWIDDADGRVLGGIAKGG